MAHPGQHVISNELLEVMDFSFLCMDEGDFFNPFIHLLFLLQRGGACPFYGVTVAGA